MTRSLLWKEWREQRWRLAFGCVMLGGFCAIGLRSRMVPDLHILSMLVWAGVVALPPLTAMGFVAPDRAARNLSFQLGLPTAPARIFLSKIIIGLAACLTPFVVICAVYGLVTVGREHPMEEAALDIAGGAVVSAQLFLWTVFLAMKQPTEARAGMAGLGLLIVWFVIVVTNGGMTNHPQIADWVFALSPLGAVFVTQVPLFDGRHIIGAFCSQAVLCVALCLLARWRFSRRGGATWFDN